MAGSSRFVSLDALDDHDPTDAPGSTGRRALGVPYELFPCDPALADTAAFCAAYGFDPEDSANTIVVIGKTDPPRFAACVTLAPYRLDVNRPSATGSARARRRSRRRRSPPS